MCWIYYDTVIKKTHCRVGWGKTPPLRVWWTSWSHTLLEHSIFLCHDSALLVEHICQFQLLWVYTFLYSMGLNEAFPKGQLAPWVGQDAPLPRASRPLGGNLPHGRGRFTPTVIDDNSLYFLCCRTCNPRVCITVSFIVTSNIDIHHIPGNTKTTRGRYGPWNQFWYTKISGYSLCDYPHMVRVDKLESPL